jgi:succinylglutamate desuccinylase
MLPGFRNFDPVREGQLLARSGPQLAREVRAPWSGTLIMPRYQGQGLDGFFLGRAVG